MKFNPMVVHNRPVRICGNEASHPEAPHEVYASCHIKIWHHPKRVSARLSITKAFGDAKTVLENTLRGLPQERWGLIRPDISMSG